MDTFAHNQDLLEKIELPGGSVGFFSGLFKMNKSEYVLYIDQDKEWNLPPWENLELILIKACTKTKVRSRYTKIMDIEDNYPFFDLEKGYIYPVFDEDDPDDLILSENDIKRWARFIFDQLEKGGCRI